MFIFAFACIFFWFRLNILIRLKNPRYSMIYLPSTILDILIERTAVSEHVP